MKKLSILFILLFFGCTPASPATVTHVPATSTIISTPTLIPTPTVTAYPLLQTDGPHILFATNYDLLSQEGYSNFVILDGDGNTGRKQFQLPNNGYIINIETAVSPDGKWLAYFTGSIRETPYDLALNLFNISDGKSYFVSNLIATGYPENLEPVIDTGIFPEDDIECSDKECQLGIIISAFEQGLRNSLDWSPDSKSIVFGAQIDGPSSDVYIYNLENKSIRRLTNELENIWSIVWSPNGEKILYLDSTPGRIFMAFHIRIADVKLQNIQNPRKIDGGYFWGSVGWIDDNLSLLWDGGGSHGGLPRNFRYINVDTQKITVFWKYETDGFMYIRDIDSLLINVYPTQEGVPLEAGTYLVSMLGIPTKISDDNYFPFSSQVFNNAFFYKSLGKIYLRNFDDTFSPAVSTEINLANTTNISISPNKEWFIISENYIDNKLYFKDLQVIQSWDVETYRTIWRPDSEGYFIRGDGTLYYVSMNDEELNLIDVCPSQDCSFRDYVWIP